MMVRVLRQVLDQLIASSMEPPFRTHPPIAFRYEHKTCPNCGARLYVKKTNVRQVVTLHIGAFVARETVMSCRECDAHPIRSDELSELVPAGSNFGYDVMIMAGRSLLLEHRTADETAVLLAARNVTVSLSEVRELAARFVAYLGIAHLQVAPAVSKLFALNGGYILHLDSTSRKHSRKMLTGIDELTGLVLLNVKLCTETADDVAAFLKEIVSRYGKPLAVGCDMASSIRAALQRVLPQVPVYICHFHFLRDAGNDMMKNDYQSFSRALDSHKVTAKLRKLQQTFKPHLTEHSEAIEQFLAEADGISESDERCSNIPFKGLLAALACSAVEAERQGDGFGFPFDRPRLQFYKHLLQVCDAVRVLRNEMTCRHEQKLADKLLKPLATIEADSTLIQLAESIERHARTFDQMRCIMRIAEPGSRGGLSHPDKPIEVSAVKEAFTAFKDQLELDNRNDPRQQITKLIEQIDRHWDGLFRKAVCVTTADGILRTIQPQRTNNIMEHFFRDYARHERRRTGTELNARRLNAMLPDTPLVCNLKNEAYLDVLLDGATSLELRFSRIDAAEVRANIAAARSDGNVFAKPRRACKVLRQIGTPLQFAADALKQARKRIKSEPT